ncbi:nitrilase-related carbon-nitrogen hydrolase [Oscillospiraceae bacterium PP1C4]
MDSFITEVLSPFHAPSADARLVIFADETIHSLKPNLKEYLLRCAEYAKSHQVYLTTGLLVHNRNLCLCLLNPQGKIICRQPAVHLAMSLRSMLDPADELTVVHTELGNLYLCVDADIYHPQTVRAAALKGADAVISIQHIDPVDDTPERLMCSVWNAAQTNNIYVVNFSGNHCTVACPAPLTRSRDGYLVRQTPTIPTRFGLNMARLDEIRRDFNIMETINTQLVQNYADELGRQW